MQSNKFGFISTMEKQKQKLFNVLSLLCFLLLNSCVSKKTVPPISPSDILTMPTEAEPEHEQKLELQLPVDAVKEGGLFTARVRVPLSPAEKIVNIESQYAGHEILFFKESSTPTFEEYVALVGIEFGLEPARSTLKVQVQTSQRTYNEERKIAMLPGEFPFEKLTVPPKTVSPSAKQMKQIEKDRAALKAVYAQVLEEKLWDPPLVLPIQSTITSIYGSSRLYNGKKQNAHLGTDLRAIIGTPIRAPIRGKVVLAKPLFFTGYTVILDHGYRFFTIYAHMSKINVKERTMVSKGEVIGLSGATGRVSGPHLHWGTQVHGVKVDPMQVIQFLK